MDKTKAVYIPKGVGNSFQTLTDDVVFTYLIDGCFDKKLEYKYLGMNYLDPLIKDV
jgi:dTDP-4-dehydrorhamnose 3,5-epimerase